MVDYIPPVFPNFATRSELKRIVYACRGKVQQCYTLPDKVQADLEEFKHDPAWQVSYLYAFFGGAKLTD